VRDRCRRQLDFVGFLGAANRVSVDLRAERDAFIADENAR
jgi:hypothetical protein